MFHAAAMGDRSRRNEGAQRQAWRCALPTDAQQLLAAGREMAAIDLATPKGYRLLRMCQLVVEQVSGAAGRPPTHRKCRYTITAAGL